MQSSVAMHQSCSRGPKGFFISSVQGGGEGGREENKEKSQEEEKVEGKEEKEKEVNEGRKRRRRTSSKRKWGAGSEVQISLTQQWNSCAHGARQLFLSSGQGEREGRGGRDGGGEEVRGDHSCSAICT